MPASALLILALLTPAQPLGTPSSDAYKAITTDDGPSAPGPSTQDLLEERERLQETLESAALLDTWLEIGSVTGVFLSGLGTGLILAGLLTTSHPAGAVVLVSGIGVAGAGALLSGGFFLFTLFNDVSEEAERLQIIDLEIAQRALHNECE